MPVVGSRCFRNDTTGVMLSGKTAIVTGSNTGIGYETALDLARRDAKVILACRNMEKCAEARTLVSVFCTICSCIDFIT